MTEAARIGSKVRVNVTQVRAGRISKLARLDDIAAEEPLEIRVDTPTGTQKLAVTMRTPGADFELALGFLLTEGIIRRPEDFISTRYCVDSSLNEEQRYNVVTVTLASDLARDLGVLERHFNINSACGVCGKTSLDALATDGLQPVHGELQLTPRQISALPAQLRDAQRLFATTGGLHAAALFRRSGELLAVREDVGRHNAFDKLVGWALMQGLLPLDNHIALVSGRASFELVQKAVAAGIPVFCAISAPSSLAVAAAYRFGVTLIGFLRQEDFNIYAHPERIRPE